MTLTKKLSETKVLWLSFFATVLITLSFQAISRQFNLVLLDGISNPADARAVITGMTEYQRNIHIWITATLDVAYPAAYGALFIGSAYRFFPSKAFLLCIPAIVCVPIDLSEGVVQILALSGNFNFIALKAVLTPAKVLLFLCGLLVTIAGWGKWLLIRFRQYGIFIS